MPLIKSLSNTYYIRYKSIPLNQDDYKNLLIFKLDYLVKKFDVNRGKNFPAYIKKILYFCLIMK